MHGVGGGGGGGGIGIYAHSLIASSLHTLGKVGEECFLLIVV